MNLQRAIQQLGIDGEDVPDALLGVAVEAYRRYQSNGNKDDIDLAVMITKAVIGMTQEGHPNWISTLNSLGLMLGSRYEQTGDIADLEEAIRVARQAVEATPEDHPDRAARLNNLGVMLGSRYKRTGNIADLEEAIRVVRQAVEATPEDHPDCIGRLNNLGVTLENRYKRIGDMADLEEAIRVACQVVEATPEDHPNRAGRLSNLGITLENRYKRIGDRADLEEAIRVARQAVEATPKDHPNRAGWLSNLGNNLENRYERTGDIADLQEAIRVARQAVETIPEDHPDRATCLNNLGNKLRNQYKWTGDITDREEAIRVARQAVEAIPEDHPDRAGSLGNLGLTLGYRYEQTGDIADLEEAIRVARQAVEATPEDHPNHIGRLNSLGAMLRSRYGRTGDITDLEEAIRVVRQAVEATPEDHPDRAGRLNNLGNNLESRYKRIGNIADLEEAIRVARQAVEATPEDHPDCTGRLSNLGNKLENRYKWMGDRADLEEAIRVARQAVEATPEDHPNRTSCLNTLGNTLESRYERTGDIADLEEAIHIARQTVEAIPEDHPSYIHHLNDLGIKLGLRYERTGDIAGLEDTIRVARQVVEATPENDPSRASRLSNLGNNLESRYEQMGDIADLEEAIRVALQAVEAIPEDHPDRAACLNNLGNKFGRRYERMGDITDLENASIHLQQAWNTGVAIPFHRIRPAALCLKVLIAQHKVDIAKKLGKNIIDLLPTVNTKLLDRGDRQYVMSTFAGVAADLCAILLASNEPSDALQYLEKGRAVILSQLIDGRSDMSDLAQKDPEIARRYKELRDKVSTPFRGLEQGAAREKILKRRRKAILDLDACIEEVRAITGYDRFLLDLTTAEMRKCAEGGSIVVVNITEFQSDAIIISPTLIKTINLSELSAFDAIIWLSREWTGPRSERAKKNKEFLAYLAWLWRSCVKQILDEIRAIHNPAGQDLLRVWWIGSGLASSMPFHAAGVHSLGTTDNAYSMALSSYAPSIKALAHARRRAKDLERAYGSLLIATMPTTPAIKDLPGVTDEKDKVLEVSKGHVATEHMDHPSVDQVIAGIRRCSVAHFACHGMTNHVDPSDSGLILQRCGEGKESDGRTGLVQDRLTVQRVSELDLRHARVAYLSACSTAQNKAERLSDEVIHVVSGFQVAGFPHVIGCLWPSNDRVCVEVAGTFYSSLFGQGGLWWESGEVALALREAVMAARAKDIGMPLYWAPYVHYGP